MEDLGACESHISLLRCGIHKSRKVEHPAVRNTLQELYAGFYKFRNVGSGLHRLHAARRPRRLRHLQERLLAHALARQPKHPSPSQTHHRTRPRLVEPSRHNLRRRRPLASNQCKEIALKRQYLGDSYDILKRFWADSLGQIAPLFAHPKFVPEEIRDDYKLITNIPILVPGQNESIGILLDPHTGIPLPSENKSAVSSSHAPLAFIVELNNLLQPKYVICFDQTYHRSHQLSRNDQLELKRAFLERNGLFSFYYLSHAPFLFISENLAILEMIRDRLRCLGIPESRLR